MTDLWQQLLTDGNFMPHGMCYLWQPGVLGLHVAADTLITLAYVSISVTLLYFVHKRTDLQFHWMFICFAVFIVACGMTHLLEIWVIWHPTYWLSGSIKALTAVASVATAILLIKLIPQALQLPSPAILRKLNDELEIRVAERTHELEAANRALRQTQLAAMQHERLRALGQMASGIAHDINNALSPAVLYSRSLLDRNASLSEETRECLADIHRSVQDVAHTVARMKDFSREREFQFSPAPVHLNRILAQVAELTRARRHDMPQARGIVVNLEMSIGTDLPQILGVESEIRDALVNLILNAVDAMPEGGTLTLRSYAVAESVPRVRVDVCDTGVGMTEETQRKCLEPFFTTKGERGTGLGLAMVYGMVQRHGAEITLTSELGRGTTVGLLFPAIVSASASLEQRAAFPPPAVRLRILLIDDDPRVSKSMCRILETEGHHVTVANGGQAGIDRFIAAERHGESFAIVISDLGMPHVDGRKVAAAIKAASPGTPFVLLTGWGHDMLTENDLPAHVDQLLSKPPDVEDLRRALFELTEGLPA